MSDQSSKNDSLWKDKLSAEEFRICRQGGTEKAFSGKYWDCKTQGIYTCKCCGEPLFSSEAKYDSGCGWPSFFQPLDTPVIEELLDESHGMVRTEIRCQQCGCHLGHVFTDGPEQTGLRYCVNSASIDLQSDSEEDKG